MDQVRNQLEEMGCMCEDWTDEKCNEVAKVLGIAVPRKIEVVDYKGAFYLKTEGFTVPHKTDPEKTSQAKGLYTRIEGWPQLLKDVEAATPIVEAFLRSQK